MRLACSRSDQNKVVSRAKGNVNIKGTVTFVPGVTQQNRDSRSVQDLIFLFLGFVLIKRIRWQGESKILLCKASGENLLRIPSTSYNKVLGRVVLRILSNIQDGFFLHPLTIFLRRCLFPQNSSNADVRNLY